MKQVWGKTYTMSGRVKMIEGNRGGGGKGMGGKVVDGRYNASLKSGKHGRKYWTAEEEKKYREKRRRNILDAEFEITPAWLLPTNGFCAIKWYPGHFFLGQDCLIISYIFIIFEIIIFSLGLEAVTEAICHTGHLLDKVVYFRHVIGNLSCIDLPLLWFLFLHVCMYLIIYSRTILLVHEAFENHKLRFVFLRLCISISCC